MFLEYTFYKLLPHGEINKHKLLPPKGPTCTARLPTIDKEADCLVGMMNQIHYTENLVGTPSTQTDPCDEAHRHLSEKLSK